MPIRLWSARLLVTLLLMLCNPPGYTAWSPVTLNSHVSSPGEPAVLSDAEWRWLGEKRQLRVAIWQPSNPPFEIFFSPQQYSGINADYLATITDRLGVKTRIQHYASREEALQSVISGESDLLVDDAGMPAFDSSKLAGSLPFLPNTPILAGRESAAFSAIDKTRPVTLAVNRDYLTDSYLSDLYPLARIERFDSNQHAIAAVTAGKADYLVANLISASFMIERNYARDMAIVAMLPAGGQGSRFVVRQDQTLLLSALNAAIGAVPESERNLMTDRWSQGSERLYLTTPLSLTRTELRWLHDHSQVKVAINPFFAPLTVTDDNAHFHGISADILRLIHLRTGLNFSPVIVSSADQMFRTVRAGDADLMAAVSITPEKESHLTFTSSYLSTPLVLVVKHNPSAPQSLHNGLKIASLSGYALTEEIKQRYPGIAWLTVDNAGAGLKQVADGKADGMIMTQLNASYMIDRYYQGQLKMVSRIGRQPANIAFAVRKDAPELESILNKALNDIPPSYITSVINRWQGTPEAQQDTWQVYDSQFYWLIALSALLLLSSLIWGVSLRRTIRVRQQAQADLLAQLSFRDILLNGSPTPVYVINPQGEIISHNRAFDRFFPGKRQQVFSLTLFDQRHPLSPLIADLARQMTTLPEQAGEQVSTCTVDNGSEPRIIVHWASPWIGADGLLAGLICGWQDITEHQQLLTAISQEKENALAANKAKGSFLATMSHEVRTPVSAIIGLLELVNSRPQRSPADDEPLRLAYGAAQSLLGIIGDILDMAKIESGQLELVPEWVAPEQLINDTLQTFTGQAQQKGLMLSFSETPDASPADHGGQQDVWLDVIRLRQVLANLIGNAVKFTHKGGVRVHLHRQRQDDHTLQLTIQISDSGSGMSANEQAQLFQPFSQLEAGRRQTGSGLGLVISKELIEKMGGRLSLHSLPGEGSTFTLQLTAAARPRAAAVGVATEPGGQGHALRLLIADDHPTNRMLLRHQLEMLGHQVQEAEDGIRALQLWQPEHFDLLITDCNMPGMDGYQLTAAIRRIDQGALIWGLTANAQPEARAHCLAAGMDECLFKPLTLNGLKQLLTEVAEKARPAIMLADAPQPARPPATVADTNLPPAPALATLIDLAALQQLTGSQTTILRQMLEKTREENQHDLAAATLALQHQAWPQLAACLHRISGAASILGAPQLESLCDALEEQCLHQPDRVEAHSLQALSQQLTTLDNAIVHWLAAAAPHA